MNIGDGTNRIDLVGGKAETNKWKHIAASFDRDGLVTLYEDGVPVSFAKMNTIGNIDSALPFTLNQEEPILTELILPLLTKMSESGNLPFRMM